MKNKQPIQCSGTLTKSFVMNTVDGTLTKSFVMNTVDGTLTKSFVMNTVGRHLDEKLCHEYGRTAP